MDNFTVTVKDWHVSEFNLQLSPLPGSTLQEYNLVEWFNNPPHPKFYQKNVEMDQRLWFSSSVVCEPSNNLSETVNQWTTFANGYYTVLHKYSDIKWHLKCFRGKCARRRSRKTETRTQSKRAFVNCDTCEFYVPVQYCTEHRLFFVRKNGGCNFTHNGHLRQERELMKMGIKQIPNEIRNDTEEMLARHVPTAIVAEVIKIRSKNYLTNASLQHLRRIVLSGGQINDTMSAAEKTLDCLRQEKGCNYSYILGSMDRAKSLITIRKGSWKLQKKSSSKSVDNDELITEENICATNEDERTRYTHSLLKGLSVGKDQVLIAVAWSTKDGYEYHKKFPRVLGMDTTNGTNNEKRGLQKLVGKTMENKNVPVMEVFVPSEQGWVFQHIITEFLPSLLDVCALKKTSLVLTDQCTEEMVAVSKEIKDDGIFNRDTRLRICKWHKVNRNYETKVTKFSSDVDREFVSQIVNWLYHITSSVETLQEEDDSISKLHQYIQRVSDDNKVSAELTKTTLDYITRSYIPMLPHLSNAYFTRTFRGKYADTGFVESENAQLAKNPLAPKPNNSLNVSCDKLLNLAKTRMRNLRTDASQSFMSQCTPCTSGEGKDNSLLVDLSKTICTVPMLDVLNEYNSRTNFMVCDVSTEEQVENGDREFLVRQRPTDFSLGESMDKNLIPKYVRTRHVLASYRPIGDRNFISFKCTCCTFYHKLVTCRHVFVLLNRPPTQIDLFPECHKAYELFYGEEGEDDFTKWVDERTLLLESIGGIQYEDTLDAICINENQLETNVQLFCGTVDSNPNRTVWTQSGWKHNDGKEIQESDDFSVDVTRMINGEKKQTSAFSMNKKMFELICNLAVTDAQKKELASGLDELHCRMRSMAISESLESTNLRTDGDDCDESVDIDRLQSEVNMAIVVGNCHSSNKISNLISP